MFRFAFCSAQLFASDTKFDSGSGWPSFTDPVSKDAVTLINDDSHGRRRTEVQCTAGKAHLGHAFPDGPERTSDEGKNLGHYVCYCINGVSLSHQND